VVRDGKPEMNHHFRSHGAMVEVLYRGQFAYCCSPNLSRDSIRQAAAQALEVARAASQTPVARFTEKERPAQTGHYTSAVGRAFTTSDVGTIVNHLVRASERLRSEKI